MIKSKDIVLNSVKHIRRRQILIKNKLNIINFDLSEEKLKNVVSFVIPCY